ncbi:cupin [Dyadobacter sp. CY261]|uniref:cupin n=1 Tax=Dyadobacter sp. CY261 TaxID=2907203 RepID=UPI001F18DC70|nr:cupin [Dyadobacter sp. CY261]MCF0069018.1 cupin [Dyadobacter sp. CY261]
MNISQPQTYFFKDDGSIPNNKFPLLVYHDAFQVTGREGAEWLEKRFAENSWTNSWRNGVFSYHHYHSITHEVLGVYAGNAVLHMGGEHGEKLQVVAGDVLVIPAGVGHRKLEASSDFAVVGAYPDGRDYDILRGEPGDRPRALENISKVPIPRLDPIWGADKGLSEIWK